MLSTMTQIRALLPTDRAMWEPLWQGYLSFYNTELTPEVTEVTWKRLIDGDTPLFGLCAINEQGEILGFVHYLFHPVTWAIGPRCYLEDLFTSPQARGQGVGRALIESVYQAADAAGADQVYWLTEESNVAARRLYDQVGKVTSFIKYRR
jgi:GNAT superfamily N-acetyltransferase